MHPKFLSVLCCPETGEGLSLRAETIDPHRMVVTGALVTPSGRSYPIVRGVPRFVSAEQYAGSFGFEWSRWPRVQFESENVGRPMEGHTTRMWERVTGVSDAQVAGRTVVDFGCGPGRFLDVVRRKGGLAVGIDLSNAVDAARQNFADDPDVLVVQGDLLRPPFKPGAFDGGFSIGVLHHTPEPERGSWALARSVRGDGWVACCVYPKGDFYDFASVRRFRAIHQKLKPPFGYRPALAYAWVAAHVLAPLFRQLKRTPLKRLAWHVERNWLVCLWLKDRRWRVLDVFDAITPAIASTHSSAEVAHWLERAGCAHVRQTPWCATSFTATRKAPAVALPKAA
jgi:SAM-dependent methyltransferase